MALTFPSNPALYEIAITGGKTWMWDGSRWIPQIITANNLVITGPLTANTSNGEPGQILTSNGQGVYWANNRFDTLQDVVEADLEANPPANGHIVTYIASEDKYYVLPLNLQAQALDGGDF
jgi:hypothetical protein